MKLGLFGGTFDPIHNGHLLTLKAAACELSLSRILIIPNPFPPHKPSQHLTRYEHRRDMVRLAIENIPEFELATIEEESEGPAYTIDTVHKVRSRLAVTPGDCWLILGADALLELENWKDPDELYRDCRIAVLPRPGWDIQRTPERFLKQTRILQTPEIAISASDIRARVAAGEPISHLVPRGVETYIRENNLYHP